MDEPRSVAGAFDEFAGSANNCLKGVQWSPDGTCLLTASEDKQLRIFELPPELSEAVGESDAAAAQASGEASGELTSSVRVCEGDNVYDYCWYPLMHSAEPASCCFFSASRDHPMHMWDAYSGALRASYAAYNHLDEVTSAYSMTVGPAGTRLYAGFDRAIRIFDVARPGRQCELRPTCPSRKSREGQRGIISCLTCSPDHSGLFAAGSYAGSVGLYVDNSPQLLCVLGGHRGGVTQVRFSHDGIHLYTGARQDENILCYDVRQSQQPLASFARRADTNQRIGFDLSADSRALVTASRDGRVLVYDVSQPQQPPSVWLTYPDAVNGATLHPFLPLLAVAVGERHFPLPVDDEDEDEDEDEEGGGGAAKEAAGGADEPPGENGLQVWLLRQKAPDAATGQLPPAEEGSADAAAATAAANGQPGECSADGAARCDATAPAARGEVTGGAA